MNIEFPKMTLTNYDLLKINPEIVSSNLASRFYQNIIEIINEFEKHLDSEHEIGVRLVSFGQTIQFHIENLGYYNSSLIIFYGRLENGARVELIQHVNQISFLLMALPKMDKIKPPKRIGFNINEVQNGEE